jgi:hypothetical protein
VTSSASSPAFDRVRQKRSCAFAHVCLRRSASISDASTVLTAVQLEAARDHCDRSRPLRRHRMFRVKYATITRRLFRPRRSQPICLCLIVNSSQDDSGCGGNARDPRWPRKAGRWQMRGSVKAVLIASAAFGAIALGVIKARHRECWAALSFFATKAASHPERLTCTLAMPTSLSPPNHLTQPPLHPCIVV